MLAKILEDMWVEPEVLEALSEDQKRILFLKMREEQVRRWKAREEKEEREGLDNARPKKASSKHVSWLLGRDGDVSVIVIGEMDEFRSSKLLQGLMNNRLCSDNINGIQTADLLPGREAQQLGFKEDIQLPLADVSEDPSMPTDQSSEEDLDSSSADDDLKDPTEDSDSESGSSSDNLSDWVPLYRPHLSSHGNEPLKAQLSDTGRTGAQDREIVVCEKKPEGRVAQLRKAFTDDLHNKSPACNKPPLPVKPAHLQNRCMSLIH
ncbi:SH2 domain-containing protein 4A isoform X1 [Acanthochromis polyacanthus]|uniref:SH2 domain-containing protein 4A isoform X1 n=1 Tax=Acanthochromis polyacanthus TaxID=80966 RepID=UPI0022340238|nr:SH2 domain-containing protein 4A isoform X1 [Acanthochromis polyacanthus]XP_051810240.1 SH2 domain-containing protein 4A isoform X1 [Acanthochromis polyacanthus]